VTNFPHKFSKTRVAESKERVDLEVHPGIAFIETKND